MRKDNFVLKIMHNYMGKGLNYIFLALGSFMVVGFLTTEDFGRLGVLTAAVLLISTVIDLGVPSFLLRYCGEYAEKKDTQKLAGIFVLSVLGAFMLGVFILFVLFLSPLPAALKAAIQPGYIWLVALFAVFRLLCQVTEIYLSVFFREGLKNAVLIFSSGIKFLLILIAVRLKAPLAAVFLIYAVPDILMTLCYSFIIQRNLSINFLRVNLKEAALEFFVKRAFIFREFSFKLLGFFWEFRFDLFAALYFSTLSSTGNYAFAMAVVSMFFMWMPDTVLQVMLRNFMVRRYASRNDTEGLSRFFKVASSVRLFFIIPLICASIIFIRPAVEVFFSGKYSSAVNVFYFFSPFLIFKSLISPIREIVVVLDRNDIPLKSNIALLYKIPLIAIFVPIFGINSLAFISGSFFFVVFLIHFFCARRIIRLSFEWEKAAKIIFNSLIASIAAFFLVSRYGGYLAGLIFSAAMMILIYLLLTFCSKVFTFSEYRLAVGKVEA